MNRKIWKALGIAVCMLALAAPRAMAKTYEVGTEDKFAEAVQEINKKSSDKINEIFLTQDINPLTGNYTLTNGKTTTIKGENHRIFIKGSNAGITVTGEKTTLNLGANGYDKKLTIEGDTEVAFITVSGRATANMYEHVTLQNRPSTGNACVVIKGLKLVTGPDSAFNMYGGVIENCRAVIADSGATFYMQSGKIKDCRFGGNRVISVTDNSKFIMEGGTISGCKADEGGGLYADHSTVTIKDGTISECEAGAGGGLYAKNQSTITIEGGTISGCEAGAGGGLYATNGSTININNGTISGCKARMGTGGGLYATNQSTININRGTISGCEAGTGGGLYADKSTVTINNGTISKCTAAMNEGGGLYATNQSTVTISGGTISGCKAPSADKGNGSGLYANKSTVTISDGTISGCDGRWGGGLYAKNSTIKITGGRIENNKAALGGGVALIGKTTFEKPITNWTVIGNEAYATGGVGGGIKLENGSMDVSDGSNRIYNNTADGHGADICLTDDTSSIKLPNAANMGATYLDSGIYIDGWYNDNPRYTPSKDVNPVDVSKTLTGKQSLIASYKADPVRIEIDANGGVGGSGSQTVQKGTNITLQAPTKEGHLFTGWKDEKGNSYPAGEDGKVNITVNEDMKLTAVWEARTFTVTYVLLDGKTRTKTAAYGQNVTLGEEPRTGYTFVGWKDGEKMYHAGETITVTGDMTLTAEWKKLPSAENLPKTGDESPVLLWGAALAVSVAACFMLRRRK